VPNDGDGDEGEARAIEEDSGGVDQAGRCVEVDTAVFYDERLADQARQVCARCPVKQPCLECALTVDRGYDFGMGWDDTKGDGIMRELHPLSGADPLVAQSLQDRHHADNRRWSCHRGLGAHSCRDRHHDCCSSAVKDVA
jgi:hypothetical protein